MEEVLEIRTQPIIIYDVTDATSTLDQSGDLKIFPNPTTNGFQIVDESGIGLMSVSLMDARGKFIRRTKI